MCNMLPAWFSGITQCSAGTSTANILQNQHVSLDLKKDLPKRDDESLKRCTANQLPTSHTHCASQDVGCSHATAALIIATVLVIFLPEKKLFARITRVRPRVLGRTVSHCTRARFCSSLLIWVDYSSQVQGPSDTLYTVGNFQDDLPSQSVDWCKTPPKLNTFWYHKVSGLPRRFSRICLRCCCQRFNIFL